jgi:ADP-ribose pyrophosphatase
MPAPRNVIIRRQTRLVDDFFKIDEIIVAYEQYDGKMSADRRRLVFERGDAVAVLILDLDLKSVVLTEQFRVPSLIGRRRDDPSTTNGWIVEAIAGMIDLDETPETAIIREAEEETGYSISHLTRIAQFFSSPGGSSERILLYFATARSANKVGDGGGVDGEDIRPLLMPLSELFHRLENNGFEDPKLIIAGYWLQRHLQTCRELAHVSNAVTPHDDAAPAAASAPLDFSTTRYALKGREDLKIGYKTGDIKKVEGVDVWVNSENTDMMMDRFLGKSISAQIRFLGANKDDQNNVFEDTIADALRSAVGLQSYVRIGTVFVTEAGMLRQRKVKQIFHVASVQGGPGSGVQANPHDLTLCIDNLFARAERENRRLLRRWFKKRALQSILIPMLGGGDGGLPVEDVAKALIAAAVNYLQSEPPPSLKEIYFLAYKSRDKAACDFVLEQFRAQGVLLREP